MPLTGEIRNLYADREQTTVVLPRTKVKAVSDDDGVGLDALIKDVPHYDESSVDAAVVPVDADSLGGLPAENFASKDYVAVKIAEAALEGSDVDLSGYATKDELNAIDFPVDSVNGKTGVVKLSASDVGAVSKTGDTMSNSLVVEATPSGAQGFRIQKTIDGVTSSLWMYLSSLGLPSFTVYVADEAYNRVVLDLDETIFTQPINFSSTDVAAQSRTNLGVGTNKVFNKLTDIGITTFPTTMKTVVNAMPNNSTLMLDSRDIIAGGTHEISDLGIGNAGMYMIMRGNSNARVSLLHIYGATGATTAYANYGCYAVTNDTVIWRRVVDTTNNVQFVKLASGKTVNSDNTSFTISNVADYKAFVFYGYTETASYNDDETCDGTNSITIPAAMISSTNSQYILGNHYDSKIFAVKIVNGTMTVTNIGYTEQGIKVSSFGVYGIK